jgi:hypothetical protein
MPFTAPNRYSPRTDWKEKLIYSSPQAGSWQSDLVIYWQWRRAGEPLAAAWSDLRMTRTNAQHALTTSTPRYENDSGLIPPEIFSRVLARSRAQDINPNDDVADVVIEDPVAPT